MDEGGGGLTALVLMCLCLFSRPARHFLFDRPEEERGREGGDKRAVISVRANRIRPDLTCGQMVKGGRSEDE